MKKAELEIVRFDAQDVIATSTTGGGKRTFTIGGLCDDQKDNLSFIDSNGTFKFENAEAETIANAFVNNELGDLNVTGSTMLFCGDAPDDKSNGSSLWNMDNLNYAPYKEKWNGVYEWVTDHFQKIQ